MSGLPKGWVEAELGDFAVTVTKGTTPTTLGFSYQSEGVTFVKAESILNHLVAKHKCAFIDEEAHQALKRSKLEAGDVLFTIAGTLGRVGVVTADVLPANTNQAVSIIRLPSVEMAPYIARHLAERATVFVSEGGRGTGLQNLNLKQVSSFSVKVPPLAEQKRIVAKLDALSARSARARKDLSRIDTLVTRYKQAVLSKAFSGELTRDWSDQWTDVKLGALLEDIRYGTSKKCTIAPELTPVLRIPNVSNGEIDLTDLKHAEFDQKEKEKLGLRKGDVLVIRSNGSLDLVGRSAVVDTEADGMLFAGYLIRLRFDQERLLPMFLHLALQGPDMRKRVEALAKSTSGVNNINSKQIQGLQLRIPPTEEQKEIVRRIESAFQKIDKLAAEAKRALAMTDKLDEAILAKAFRGELVPQDPGDEPASVLLERIKAERKAAPKVKRGRGRR